MIRRRRREASTQRQSFAWQLWGCEIAGSQPMTAGQIDIAPCGLQALGEFFAPFCATIEVDGMPSGDVGRMTRSPWKFVAVS